MQYVVVDLTEEDVQRDVEQWMKVKGNHSSKCSGEFGKCDGCFKALGRILSCTCGVIGCLVYVRD